MLDLSVESRQLLVERSNDSNCRVMLAVEVRHFLADVVNLALQATHSPLKLVSLTPDSSELLLLLPQLRVTLLLRAGRSRECNSTSDKREREQSQTRRR